MKAAEWIVRRAAPEDLELILALEVACAEAPHWSEAVWSALLSEEEGCGGIVRASFVAEGNDGIVGFLVASCAGGVAEIETVAVGASMRRQGVGKALCIAAMDWARGIAARGIELEVRASSRGALALYRSLGFGELGMRRGYYRDPVEDAVLMSAPLRG